MADVRRGKPPWTRAYSFLWVTLALFLISWVGQFLFQMNVVRNQADQYGQPFAMSDFLVQFGASTLENWQSEFLQLCWQAAGLAFLLFWGSSQSKEGNERLEAKVDALMRDRGLDPDAVGEEAHRRVTSVPSD